MSLKISKNLQQRIIAASALAPIVLVIVLFGNWLYSLLIIAASVIMSFEWANIISPLAKKKTTKKAKQPSGFIAKIKSNEYLKWQLVGIVYIALFGTSLIYLRYREDGLFMIFYLLTVVWATDIGAYFSGRIIGGAKLAPKISPNKTWAGLIGGACLAVFFSVFFSTISHKFNLVSLALITACLAVCSQMGDLFESWVKRKFDVKDSGNIIPGHGGVLDRVDGLIPVSILLTIASTLIYGRWF